MFSLNNLFLISLQTLPVMNKPPSFQPRSHSPRPRAEGAQVVGASTPPVRRSITHPQPQPEPAPAAPPTAPPAPAPQPHYVHNPNYQIPPVEAQPEVRRRSPKKVFLAILGVLLALVLIVLAWGGYLLWKTSSQLHRVDMLSDLPNTSGTTYLLIGSDARALDPGQAGAPPDGTEGERSDTMMLVHAAPNGQAATISLPRDLLVDIPNYGQNKLNASFSFGGPQLLVQTVEGLTGLKIDHVMMVGMGGVEQMVNAVGGVDLCYDYNVSDELSGMNWQAGCHHADGRTALAFSRMRYSDPLGDIGRTERQRQVIAKTMKQVLSKHTIFSPTQQLRVIDAATGALTVDEDTGVLDLVWLAKYLRNSGHEHLQGTLPLASLGESVPGIGSCVILDESRFPDFLSKLRDGTLTPADFKNEF